MDAGRELSEETILITGASGFTGGHACKYYAGELGMQVIGLVRKESDFVRHEGVTYIERDLGDLEGLRSLIQQVQPNYVLHLAGKNAVGESWENPILYMRTNIQYTLHVLDALRELPTARLLVVGSSLATPLTSPSTVIHPYGLSKSLQKAAILSWQSLFNQDVMVVEPSNLIGPGPSTGFCSLLGRYIVLCELGKTTTPFKLSSAHHQRDFLDVRDAIVGYDQLLRHGKRGEVYRIRSGHWRSLGEVTDLMVGLTDTHIPVEYGDENSQAHTDSRSGALHEQIDYVHTLGWKPKVSFEQSLQDVIVYFRHSKGGFQ